MPAATNFDIYKMIRNLWPREAIVEQILRASPALGLIKKDTNFAEKIRYISVGTTPPQGLGDFDQAKRNKTPSTAVEFQLRTASYFGNFSIGGDLYRKAKYTGNKGLLKEPMERESKGIMKQSKNDFSSFIHGNGGGSLGRIKAGSVLTSNQVTLDKGVDARRLVKGMTLWGATTDGTTGAALNGQATVKRVLKNAAGEPVVEINEASWAAAISGITDTSYLFRAGAFGPGTVFYGFDAWCPYWDASTPPPDFLGVPRADAPEQLAGISLTLQNKSPRQRVMLAAQAQADSGSSDGRLVYLLNTSNWMDLQFELSSMNALIQTKAPSAPVSGLKTGVEYDAIRITGPGGPIDIIADPWAPTNVERLLNIDTWKMSSVGDWFHWDDDATPDSPNLEDAADAREVRAVGDHQLECWDPWANVRVKVAA